MVVRGEDDDSPRRLAWGAWPTHVARAPGPPGFSMGVGRTDHEGGYARRPSRSTLRRGGQREHGPRWRQNRRSPGRRWVSTARPFRGRMGVGTQPEDRAVTNPFTLEGMRIAITGAGGGIGSTAARIAAGLGADVLVSDLEAPDAVADSVREQGRQSEASALDVTDRAAVEGVGRGLRRGRRAHRLCGHLPLRRLDRRRMGRGCGTGVRHQPARPLNLVRAFMASMAERGGGRIAMVGSIAAGSAASSRLRTTS